jgi:hypothetical protein
LSGLLKICLTGSDNRLACRVSCEDASGKSGFGNNHSDFIL